MALCLKRFRLDKEDMKRKNPHIFVLYLTLYFSRNLLKRTVSRRVEVHLKHNDLHDIYPSSYLLRGHSTGTGRLIVDSDIAETLGEGSMAALIMVDLSAALL